MGQATYHEEFEWKHDLEPHKSRRTMMLKQYPEIKKLFVVDPWFKWQVTGIVVFQLVSSYFFSDLPWWAVVCLSYALGGTLNHSLMLAVHEISHSHAFGYCSPALNRWFGIFANLPVGIPFSCAFKKYHMIHHRFLGQDGVDADLPTEFEGRLFRGPFMKAIWLCLQSVTYTLRPFIVSPMPLAPLEGVNIVVQGLFDVLVYWIGGPKMLFYLAAGSLMSMGLHPMAGHFITEHFLWPRFNATKRAAAAKDSANAKPSASAEDETLRKLQVAEGNETFSYYGPLNLIAWNVGYHVAHHDFPAIPASLLPEVHKIAPEWYEHIPAHNSWSRALFEFITDPALGPFNRVKRDATQPATLAHAEHDE